MKTMNPFPAEVMSEIDPELVNITLTLSTSQRIQRWLNARQLAVGLRLGQLRKQYPNLSTQELNLKMIESFNDEH